MEENWFLLSHAHEYSVKRNSTKPFQDVWEEPISWVHLQKKRYRRKIFFENKGINVAKSDIQEKNRLLINTKHALNFRQENLIEVRNQNFQQPQKTSNQFKYMLSKLICICMSFAEDASIELTMLKWFFKSVFEKIL